MKKLFLAVLIIFWVSTVQADPFSWGHSDRADGYKIYYTDLTDVTQHSKDVGYVNSYELALEPGHDYELVCVAYNTAGESPPSNQIEITAKSYVATDNPQVITVTIPEKVFTFLLNVISEE